MSKFALVRVENGQEVQRVNLPTTRTMLGKEWFQTNMDIPEIAQLSRQHVEISPEREGVRMRFCGSNKPSKNGEALPKDADLFIKPSELFSLVMHRSAFRIEAILEAPKPPLSRVATDDVMEADEDNLLDVMTRYLQTTRAATGSQNTASTSTQLASPIRPTFASPSSAPTRPSLESPGSLHSHQQSPNQSLQTEPRLPEWLSQLSEVQEEPPNAQGTYEPDTSDSEAESVQSALIGVDSDGEMREPVLTKAGKQMDHELNEIVKLANETRSMLNKLDKRRRKTPQSQPRAPKRTKPRQRRPEGLFSEDIRKQLKQDYPDAEADIIDKMIKTRWRNLSREETDEWIQMAADLNELNNAAYADQEADTDDTNASE